MTSIAFNVWTRVAKDLTALRCGGKLSVGLRLPEAVRGHLWFLVPSRTTPSTYSLKSLGWFELPPLGEQTNIDVYEQATAMKNPGAVRRIDPKRWEKSEEAPDPLEELLKRAKQSRNTLPNW
ncbi:MAG: hypothetical protein VB878_15460 [Pirellulaceae bacterium]